MAEIHEPPHYLGEKLREAGKSSFRELCANAYGAHSPAGSGTCPCQELAFYLDLLCTLQVKLKARGTKIDLRSLDSYDSALGEFTLQDIKKIEDQVAELIAQINLLKRAPLVRELNARDRIPPGDVLSRADLPCDSHFETLLNLRKIAKSLLGDPRRPRKPDFDFYLGLVYGAIHLTSEGWYDELVADILNDLFSQRREPFTQSGLKQWRYQRGMINPK